MKQIVFVMGAAILLYGCTYAISPSLAKQADKNISFPELEADPAQYKDKLVILGGTIVVTTNEKQESLIEIVQKPLDAWGKPLSTDRSGGRFILVQARHLDPFFYSPGRNVTAAAVVAGGVRAGLAADDAGSAYPVLLSRELKLWPAERHAITRPQHLDPLLYDPYARPVQP